MGNNRTLNKAADFFAAMRDLFSILWKVFAIRVLKRKFGIETKAYNKWHDKRAYRLQQRLDWEHNTTYAANMVACDYE